MPSNWIFWVVFNVFVLAMLALDLGVFHRHKHEVGFREAISWTVVWISLAGLFAVLIYFFGHTLVGENVRPNSQLSLEFATGYLIELSLSVDNLFVFLILFQGFRVSPKRQHTALAWGVAGAVVLRGLFIAAGITLLSRFEWITWIFGLFLLYAAFRLLRGGSARAAIPG